MEKTKLWPEGPTILQTELVKLTGDSILLADFARISEGEKGVDLCCGSGALMLLLLWRERTINMTGLEIQQDAASLAEETF